MQHVRQTGLHQSAQCSACAVVPDGSQRRLGASDLVDLAIVDEELQDLVATGFEQLPLTFEDGAGATFGELPVVYLQHTERSIHPQETRQPR